MRSYQGKQRVAARIGRGATETAPGDEAHFQAVCITLVQTLDVNRAVSAQRVALLEVTEQNTRCCQSGRYVDRIRQVRCDNYRLAEDVIQGAAVGDTFQNGRP